MVDIILPCDFDSKAGVKQIFNEALVSNTGCTNLKDVYTSFILFFISGLDFLSIFYSFETLISKGWNILKLLAN